jgi:hypothetical protein
LTRTSHADAQPTTPAAIRTALTKARADFAAARYVVLADHLPALVATAETSAAVTTDRATHALVAQTYNLVTRALIKLRKGGLEWVSADRALRATTDEDPVTHAESLRLMGSVLRRAGHHDRAQDLTLAATQGLTIHSRQPPADHLSLYGELLCSAGYAAARAGDRDRATDLLTEASTTATRLAGLPQRQHALTANVISHQVSAAYLLGDAGTALHHARTARLDTFPSAERQGRLLVDVALAYAQWDKPGHAYRALLAAEHRAPGEVRTRATVRDLITTLMKHGNTTTMPGLRQLAARTHALS